MAPPPPAERPPSFAARLPFFYGWVIVGVSALSIASSAPGQTNLIAALIDPMMKGLSVDRGTITAMFTVGTLAASFGMAFVGFSIDRIGPRTVMIVSVLLFGVVVMLMGAIPANAGVVTVIGLGLGFFGLRLLGRGALNMLGTILVSFWFRRMRGRATSVASGMGWLVGLGTLPPASHWLIAEFGWRGAWVALGLGVWVVMLLPAIFLVRKTPESVGLLPDGDRPSEAHEHDQPGGATPAGAASVPEDNWTVREAIRARSLWFILIAAMAWSTLGAGILFHQVSVLEERGISEGVARSSIAAVAVMNFVGNVIAGYLNDRFPNHYTLFLAQVALLLALLMSLVVGAAWHAWVYAGLLGMTQGMTLNTGTVIWANYFGRANLGSIRGATMWVVGVTSAVGPLPLAYLHDATGSYTLGVWIYVGLLLPMMVAALLATKPTRPQLAPEAAAV